MTREYYSEMHRSLYERMKNARDHLCPRTAMARIRDMARLMSEFTGASYDECLEQLTKQHMRNGKV